jgi:parvulin-like peptidyl-prolyl isomerase
MMTAMKWMGLAAIAALAWCGSAKATMVDQVAATVGSEVILRSDLLEEVMPLIEGIQRSAASQEDFNRQSDQAFRDALGKAVENKILFRQAQLAGLKIDDKTVEERFDKVRKQYATQEEFMKVLTEAGESVSDFRERLRKQLVAVAMGMRKRKEFDKEAVVSEADMRAYYQEHVAEFARLERVRLRRLFLPADTPEARAKARAQAEVLREEVLSGADFGELARRQSGGPDAKEGGLVGWVSRGDLVPELESVAFALPAGGVSEAVETEFGVTLVKVEEREAAGQASYEDARTRIEPILRAKVADARFAKWIEGLRKSSRVRVFL